MSREPLARMDIDTRWPYHRKCRALQAAFSTDWPSYWCAYLAVLGESWAAGERMTIRDAWVPSLPVTIEAAAEALASIGLLDKSGKVPQKSWDEWFGPAAARIDSLKARGRMGAAKRWNKREKAINGHKPSDGPAMAQPSVANGQSMHHASQPATPATPASHATDAPAFDVMLLVENLTRRPFNYREGHQVHDILVGDVSAHGADAIGEAYREFQRSASGPVDAAQIVFGVHNRLHPLTREKPMTDEQRKDAEIAAYVAEANARAAAKAGRAA